MVKITIATDNAAFEEDRAGELVRMLRQLVKQVEGGWPPRLYDRNGNLCGTVTLTGADKELAR